MYDYVLNILCRSNLGSFEKEDIISNKLIKPGKTNKYYEDIVMILKSNKSGFEKDSELMNYLKTH